jgi:hypothetical protein
MQIARRTFLHYAYGVGAAALAELMNPRPAAAAGERWTGAATPRHHRPRARRVIFLYMAGGPSHLETFDYKPKLVEGHGRPMPESVTQGQPIAQLQGQKLLMQRPLVGFRPHGKSGLLVSDYMRWTPLIADEIAVIKSMHTEQINHDPAHTFMNTGTAINGRPSMGSWVLYGLGSESQNLPGFIVLTSVKGRNPQPIASRQWHSGFLPGQFQGVEFQTVGDPVHYLASPPGYNAKRQRDVLDAIGDLNRRRQAAVANPELETRIAQYEMAFRMQASVPDLMDFSKEPEHILRMYGAKSMDGSFAANCLLARRLAERGVRFIQLYHRGWDHHDGLDKYMKLCCDATEQGTAALVLDLKQRGMLEDTLVVWGGEFGRTPMAQTNKGEVGRDHHIRGFTIWMAGAGVKGGITYGETDELGYFAAEKPVHVRDLHATMLHLLGIDHERMKVKVQGLDMSLTGVEKARVLHPILT